MGQVAFYNKTFWFLCLRTHVCVCAWEHVCRAWVSWCCAWRNASVRTVQLSENLAFILRTGMGQFISLMACRSHKSFCLLILICSTQFEAVPRKKGQGQQAKVRVSVHRYFWHPLKLSRHHWLPDWQSKPQQNDLVWAKSGLQWALFTDWPLDSISLEPGVTRSQSIHSMTKLDSDHVCTWAEVQEHLRMCAVLVIYANKKWWENKVVKKRKVKKIIQITREKSCISTCP